MRTKVKLEAAVLASVRNSKLLADCTATKIGNRLGEEPQRVNKVLRGLVNRGKLVVHPSLVKQPFHTSTGPMYSLPDKETKP